MQGSIDFPGFLVQCVTGPMRVDLSKCSSKSVVFSEPYGVESGKSLMLTGSVNGLKNKRS